MCAYASAADRSSAAFHLKSYRLLQPFMDRSKYGSMMLILREKNFPDAHARRRAGLDIVDIFSIGTDPADPQILHIHTLNHGDDIEVLEHTYMYWAQLVTMTQRLEQWYHVHIPKVSHPKKENGLLSCVELDGGHMAKLPDRYVVWTFKLKARGKHRCPEETGHAAANTVVSLGELGEICCPYCLADNLNLNLK